MVLKKCLPVQRNGKKICNTSRAGHDIGGNPELAKISSKAPRAGDIVDQGERHDHGGNEKVRDGHGNEEQVWEFAEVAVRGDGNADQDVAQNGRGNLQQQKFIFETNHKK